MKSDKKKKDLDPKKLSTILENAKYFKESILKFEDTLNMYSKSDESLSEDLGIIFKRIQSINSEQEKENQDQEVIRSKIDDLQGKFGGIRRYAGTKCLSDGQSASFLLERERNENKGSSPEKPKKKESKKNVEINGSVPKAEKTERKLERKESKKNVEINGSVQKAEKTERKLERNESKSKVYKKILPPPGVSRASIK